MGVEEPSDFDWFQMLANAHFQVNPDFIEILAVKPAESGDGVILRIFAPQYTGQPVTIAAPDWQVKTAYLCDVRERQICPLEVNEGRIMLSMPGSIASILIQT
jgi:alpha-mannosidase